MSPDARREAAIALVAGHDAALRRMARRHSLCAADAEDAYQRALLIALRKAPDLEPPALSRWMHAVVRNEAFAVRRERERLFALAGDADGHDPDAGPASSRARAKARALLPPPPPEPHDRAEHRERVATVARALRTLKPQERRAIRLFAAGLSYAEIAELCGWTHTKVNRCLAEGREALRDRLARLEAA